MRVCAATVGKPASSGGAPRRELVATPSPRPADGRSSATIPVGDGALGARLSGARLQLGGGQVAAGADERDAGRDADLDRRGVHADPAGHGLPDGDAVPDRAVRPLRLPVRIPALSKPPPFWTRYSLGVREAARMQRRRRRGRRWAAVHDPAADRERGALMTRAPAPAANPSTPSRGRRRSCTPMLCITCGNGWAR